MNFFKNKILPNVNRPHKNHCNLFSSQQVLKFPTPEDFKSINTRGFKILILFYFFQSYNSSSYYLDLYFLFKKLFF